jgi:hypothetical protein
MRAIDSMHVPDRAGRRHLISPWIQNQSARLARLTSGPLLWLGLALLALAPLLLE